MPTAIRERLLGVVAVTTLLFSAALGLSACGSSTSDRALSGGAIGAGVGAVGGVIVGAPVAGAVIGGAAGAAAGALTDENQINLGKPVWR
jgi:osmotically inducible lipoprotein OsmB